MLSLKIERSPLIDSSASSSSSSTTKSPSKRRNHTITLSAVHHQQNQLKPHYFANQESHHHTQQHHITKSNKRPKLWRDHLGNIIGSRELRSQYRANSSWHQAEQQQRISGGTTQLEEEETDSTEDESKLAPSPKEESHVASGQKQQQTMKDSLRPSLATKSTDREKSRVSFADTSSDVILPSISPTKESSGPNATSPHNGRHNARLSNNTRNRFARSSNQSPSKLSRKRLPPMKQNKSSALHDESTKASEAAASTTKSQTLQSSQDEMKPFNPRIMAPTQSYEIKKRLRMHSKKDLFKFMQKEDIKPLRPRDWLNRRPSASETDEPRRGHRKHAGSGGGANRMMLPRRGLLQSQQSLGAFTEHLKVKLKDVRAAVLFKEYLIRTHCRIPALLEEVRVDPQVVERAREMIGQNDAIPVSLLKTSYPIDARTKQNEIMWKKNNLH